MVKTDECSHLHYWIHYVGIWHRDGYPSFQKRTICAPWKMEHDDMHWRDFIYAPSYLGTDHRLANVQPMLWKSYLVPDEIRFPDTDPALYHDLLPPLSGRSYQYSVDENTESGPQRADLSFTYDLLLTRGCSDIREYVRNL
jgi:hypothetical protein